VAGLHIKFARVSTKKAGEEGLNFPSNNISSNHSYLYFMLPKGLISQVLDCFTEEPKFAPAMEESLCDFFDVASLKELGKLNISKMSNDFFNEWLVFDCVLINSKRTVLEEYLFIHQKQLSREYKNIYSDLILTNHYSLFRHDFIEPDKSIAITDMLNDKKYIISERKATKKAVLGNYSFLRIASVGDHYEVVSADGFQLSPSDLPLKFITDWKKRKIKFSPLVVYQQMLKPIESRDSENPKH